MLDNVDVEKGEKFVEWDVYDVSVSLSPIYTIVCSWSEIASISVDNGCYAKDPGMDIGCGDA